MLVYQHFSPFPSMFSKSFFLGMVKMLACLTKCYGVLNASLIENNIMPFNKTIMWEKVKMRIITRILWNLRNNVKQ